MVKTQFYKPVVDDKALAKELNLSPVLTRIMANRGLHTAEEMKVFLEGDAKALHDPWLLPDMKRAVQILEEKLSKHRRIRIIGDYDVDGVCSTVIFLKGLSALGADVSFDIPDRKTDGYGLSERLVEKAAKDGVDTILTCDNGTSALSQIRLAKALGMTVIVTDHHELSKEGLPEAEAFVNPHRTDSTYPFPGICGAVVALKLMMALIEDLGADRAGVVEMLMFAGIATVCDVMTLVNENRLIVKTALRLLATRPPKGIKKLCECFEMDHRTLSVYDLGFRIGPAINAGGRMEKAHTGVKLLMDPDEEEIQALAEKLFRDNEERKSLTEQAFRRAEKLIEEQNMADEKAFPVLVLYIPGNYESVAGIVASRIKEKYFRPVFVLTDQSEGGVKGSGRSIPAYSMYDKMCECAGFLEKFGGHPMAAGLSLTKDNVEPFAKAMREKAGLTPDELCDVVMIDMNIPLWCCRTEFYDLVEQLQPFGEGNPRPLFLTRQVPLKQMALMGKEQTHARLTVLDENGRALKAVLFQRGKELKEEILSTWGEEEWDRIEKGVGSRRIALIYSLGIDDFRGQRLPQLELRRYMLEQ